MHIVLLGDSIFDNQAYTHGQPPVIEQLRRILPTASKASLYAVDGSVTRDVVTQVAQLPTDTTHLVVSAGGNDALLQTGLFSESAQTAAEVIERITQIMEQFTSDYRAMLAAVRQQGCPVAVCTIYDPNMPERLVQRLMTTGVSFFNSVIIHEASAVGVPIIDLRRICTTPEDYANEIEPSSQGGAKIADAIRTVVTTHDFNAPRSCLYP